MIRFISASDNNWALSSPAIGSGNLSSRQVAKSSLKNFRHPANNSRHSYYLTSASMEICSLSSSSSSKNSSSNIQTPLISYKNTRRNGKGDDFRLVNSFLSAQAKVITTKMEVR